MQWFSAKAWTRLETCTMHSNNTAVVENVFAVTFCSLCCVLQCEVLRWQSEIFRQVLLLKATMAATAQDSLAPLRSGEGKKDEDRDEESTLGISARAMPVGVQPLLLARSVCFPGYDARTGA